MEKPLLPPVFVIGLPRTGTTFLHHLLALDTNVRCPLTYEVRFFLSLPCSKYCLCVACIIRPVFDPLLGFPGLFYPTLFQFLHAPDSYLHVLLECITCASLHVQLLALRRGAAVPQRPCQGPQGARGLCPKWHRPAQEHRAAH